MKFNWGTGIVIFMAAFMVFILQYVIKVQLNPKYDNELVTENYYQEEVKVDGDRLRDENTKELSIPVEINTVDDGIQIIFPSNLNHKDISGTIFLYRPSNQRLDFEIPISLSSSNLLIPNKILKDGRWNITVQWDYKDKGYKHTELLNLKE